MRRLLICLSVIGILLAGVPPVAASGPVANGYAPDAKPDVLTPAEQRIVAVKTAKAEAILSDMRGLATIGASDALTPDVFCEGDPPCLPGGAPSSRVLLAYARQQDNCAYCGPASGQVAINFSRGIFYSDTNGDSTAHNYKTQPVIASAMGTSLNGGTTGSGVKNGLNAYAQLPAGFIYAWQSAGDAEYLYSLLIADVYEYSMVMVLPVRPHQPGATYWLSSWPLAASSSGHYIALHGYRNFWSDASPRQAIAYYADSASGCAGSNVGVTGKWTDPIYDLKYTNNYSGYVVW